MSRWKKWLLRFFVLGIVFLIGLPLMARWYVRYAGRQHLARVTAHLDATDPGWQLDDILAVRETEVPAEENIYVVTEKLFNPTQPETYRKWSVEFDDPWPPAGVPNLPSKKQLAAAREARDSCRSEIEQLRKIRGLSRGGFQLELTPNILDVKLEHVQRLRTAAGLLALDAVVSAAGDKNADRAVHDCHAILDSGKAVSGDPMLIEMLVRVAISAVAVENTERVLAWGKPTTGLAELQAAFLAEADTPLLAQAIRGDRGMMSRFFDNFESGTAPNVSNGFVLRTYLPETHAVYLEYMTAHLEVTRRPSHERKALAAAIPAPPRSEYRYTLLQLILPAMDKMVDVDPRRMARLRSAAVALACERNRRANGSFPKTLADIPKDILPAIPADPYDGKPLRYFRTEDGAIVYSVGPDMVDDGGKLSRTYKADAVGEDYGVRLWDADKRRAAPLAKLDPEDKP